MFDLIVFYYNNIATCNMQVLLSYYFYLVNLFLFKVVFAFTFHSLKVFVILAVETAQHPNIGLAVRKICLLRCISI